jgi:predicted Fe-S protein YdhL (DUF1289 family)
MPQPIPATMPTSPCVGVCRIEENCGLCVGCARSRTEIAAWIGLSDTAREAIWSALPARRASLGLKIHRRAWSREDIRRFVRRTLTPGAGTWVAGVHGALAEFTVGDGEQANIVEQGEYLTATTPRGAVRFRIADEVRALGFGDADIVVLAVPLIHAPVGSPGGLAALGPDTAAIRDNDRSKPLFDFGLGFGFARFVIRVDDPALADDLGARVGQPWPTVLAASGRQILDASPARVVLHAIGRVEVYTPIPLPGGRTQPGPHTHFLPEFLAARRGMPPGLELPETHAPCAIYYPATAAIPNDRH